MTELNSDWTTREKPVLERIEKQLKWHNGAALRSFWTERALAIVVLVCAVLAPLTVASADNAGLGVFGFPNLPSKRLRWCLRSPWRWRKVFVDFVNSTNVIQSLHSPARNSAMEGNSTLIIKSVFSRAATNGVRTSTQFVH
jgi:hypothetical protein